jgi:hypothetical protein
MSIPFHTNDLEIDQHQSLDMIKNNKTKWPACGSKTVPSPGRIRAKIPDTPVNIRGLYELAYWCLLGRMIPIYVTGYDPSTLRLWVYIFFWIFNFDPAGSISILYTLANNIRMVYWINILANIHILILLLAKINNFLPQILLMAENL